MHDLLQIVVEWFKSLGIVGWSDWHANCFLVVMVICHRAGEKSFERQLMQQIGDMARLMN